MRSFHLLLCAGQFAPNVVLEMNLRKLYSDGVITVCRIGVCTISARSIPQPLLKLIRESEHSTAFRPGRPVNRKPQLLLVTLNRADTAPKVGSNLLPGIQDARWRLGEAVTRSVQIVVRICHRRIHSLGTVEAQK